MTSPLCTVNPLTPTHRAGGSASSDVVQFEDVTYTVEVIKMYKEEDGETYGSELTFTTSASSSLCGISLEISDGEYLSGQEYLLDLNRHESTNELRAVGLCGVFKDWSDDDEAVLEGGCPSTPSPGLSPGQVGEQKPLENRCYSRYSKFLGPCYACIRKRVGGKFGS